MKKFSLILAVALALCLAVMPSLAANAFPAASGSYSNSGAIQGSNMDYEVAKALNLLPEQPAAMLTLISLRAI